MTSSSNPRLRVLASRVVAGVALTIGAVVGLALTVAPAQAASVTPGLDVSSFQGSDIDWAAQYANGARFMYTKATEGTSLVDPNAAADESGAAAAGLIHGGYHFAHPNESSGAAQADFFIAHGGGWTADGATLPGALDIEYNPSGAECYGLSQASMVAWIADFSDRYQSVTGRYPMIYTTLDWWVTCTGSSTAFAATNPFMGIGTGTTPPTLPGGIGTVVIWTTGTNGPFAGEEDYFNGDLAALQAFASDAS